MMQMVNKGLLWVETIANDKASMTDVSDKEVCRVQFTPGVLSKLVLTKPTATHKNDYDAMSYNYGHLFPQARSYAIKKEGREQDNHTSFYLKLEA